MKNLPVEKGNLQCGKNQASIGLRPGKIPGGIDFIVKCDLKKMVENKW